MQADKKYQQNDTIMQQLQKDILESQENPPKAPKPPSRLTNLKKLISCNIQFPFPAPKPQNPKTSFHTSIYYQ